MNNFDKQQLNKQRYENSIFETTKGCKFKVIKYENANNVLIEFQDEHKYRCYVETRNIKTGNIRNPYYPQVYGIGYLGNIDFQVKVNGKHIKEYEIWSKMLDRCYSNKYPTYKNCTVCKEWQNFTNFYNWIIKQENYSKLKSAKLQLDKDILSNGSNKIYSPNTCCLIPQKLNMIFSYRREGKYGLAVSGQFDKNNKIKCFGIRTVINGERKFIKCDKDNAFLIYKKYKEQEVKRLAQEYYNKGLITEQCYKQLMKYEVKNK